MDLDIRIPTISDEIVEMFRIHGIGGSDARVIIWHLIGKLYKSLVTPSDKEIVFEGIEARPKMLLKGVFDIEA